MTVKEYLAAMERELTLPTVKDGVLWLTLAEWNKLDELREQASYEVQEEAEQIFMMLAQLKQ